MNVGMLASLPFDHEVFVERCWCREIGRCHLHSPLVRHALVEAWNSGSSGRFERHLLTRGQSKVGAHALVVGGVLQHEGLLVW